MPHFLIPFKAFPEPVYNIGSSPIQLEKRVQGFKGLFSKDSISSVNILFDFCDVFFWCAQLAFFNEAQISCQENLGSFL